MKAYALREEYAGTVTVDGAEVPKFSGGVLSIGSDGHSFDVRAELDKTSDGILVVDDPDVETVLDHYLPVVPVDLPADHDRRVLSGYSSWSVGDIRGELKRRGFVGTGRIGKDAGVVALSQHDDRLAAGDVSVNDASVITVNDDGSLTTPADEAAAEDAAAAGGENTTTTTPEA